MKALILSGGGALGAFEAGAIKALDDNGHKFDLICGTSIGAINASFVAQDKISDLTALWQNIAAQTPPIIDYVDQVQHALDFVDEIEKLGHRDILALGPAIERWMQIGSKKSLLALRGAVKPDAIENILEANLDYNALRRSLIVTATNLTYGSSEAFFSFVGPDCNQRQAAFREAFGKIGHSLSAANFKVAVRASAAIPGFFAPVPMNYGTPEDKDYVDGGVANNTPAQLAVMAGATDIVVILLQPEQSASDTFVTKTLPEIGLASYIVMQQQLLKLDMNFVTQHSGVKIQSIRPSVPLTLGLLGFNDQDAINGAFQEGEDTVNAMPELRRG